MFRLNLKEIPQEGREYHFTKSSGELTDELKDLLGDTAFEIQFSLKPLGGAYEIQGKIRTQLPSLCSACGWDLPFKLEKPFHEFLVEERPDLKGTHASHGSDSLNLDSEDESYGTYKNDQFSVGEYFHEMIAVAEPSYLTCGDKDCSHLKQAKEILSRVQSEARSFDEKVESPFAVLKKLKSDLKS